MELPTDEIEFTRGAWLFGEKVWMVCGGARGGNLSVKKSGRVTSVLLYWHD